MKWSIMRARLQKATKSNQSPFKGYSLSEAYSLLVRERFITRAAQSKASNAFIFKGGLLLTMIYAAGGRAPRLEPWVNEPADRHLQTYGIIMEWNL